MIEKFVLVLIFAILAFWLFAFIKINDFRVPTKKLKEKANVLVVYPHPDDEVFNVGGTITSRNNITCTLLILTKGEKGTKDGTIDNHLKKIRADELKKSASILNVSRLIHHDLGDGELQNKKRKVKKIIQDTIKRERPGLVITYDLSGLYGHPDHIIVSEIVTELIKKKYSNINLWYSTMPVRLFNQLKLPEHMAKNNSFKSKRTLPTHKVFIGLNIIRKVMATIAHKSQYHLFQEGMPIPIPSAFFHSLTLFEYFHEVDIAPLHIKKVEVLE